MNIHNSSALTGAFLTLAVSSVAHAHHSGAVFDSTRAIELRGVVVDFKLRSPHSSFVIDALAFVDGAAQPGGVQRWELESQSLPVLRTMGIDEATFRSGDAITITAVPHRDPTFRFASASVITRADGKTYSLVSSNRIYSPSLRQAMAAATGAEVSVDAHDVPVPAVTGAHRAEGRWQQPMMQMVTETVLPLNEAGMAARRDYNRKESPANTCEPMSVPDVFNAPFYLFDLRLEDRQAVLHNEAYDIIRRIPLDGEARAADADGYFGVVTGRIEGDTLVVESSDHRPSAWGLGAEVQPFGAGADIPSSEHKVVTEKFTASEDGRTLIYEYTLHDPVYMREPYSERVELTRVPDGTQMYAYECDLESAAMWSRDPGEAPLRIGDD